MPNHMQLPLFDDTTELQIQRKTARSGTFVDNMSLPVHRWFRYSAGFSAEWVEQILSEWEIGPESAVLDPFAGSGTVALACEKRGVHSFSVEAHPFVARLCTAKLLWPTSIKHFAKLTEKIIHDALHLRTSAFEYPELIQRSFDPIALAHLHAFKLAWNLHNDLSPASELARLAITAILRPCSKAGTAQWQYILPNKTKKTVLFPDVAFQQQIAMMLDDMWWMQSQSDDSRATVINGDARNCSGISHSKIDAVITSPPYANNYDYADALRFEMTFWGEVSGWGDIHDKVRKHLIVSSSQHSSKERLDADELVSSPSLAPIRSELTEVVNNLAIVRNQHGGKKHYHTMIAAYCRDLAEVFVALRTVCRPGARMAWVVGDSAPYGIYCPIDRWIGELALGAGFVSYKFDKLRDRNTKWKNRKHRVPLKEGILWIGG